MGRLRWIPVLAVLAGLACDRQPVARGEDGGMVALEDPVLGTFEIDRYEYPNVRGSGPLAATDLAMAERACADLGKRLCTAAEWRRACRGPAGDLRYGYGATYAEGRCHIGEVLPSGFASVNEYESAVAGSGAHRKCRTPEGVYDLIGNVEEWVLDDWNGQGGMLEGGAWYTQEQMADCSGLYARQPDYRLQADQAVFSAGFRCCRSAEAPSQDDVARDARRRIEEAMARDSDAAYASDDEVPIPGGGWVDRFEYPNREGEFPRTAVSWTEASGLCQAAGKRLCSAREWARACGGEQLHPYPPGNVHLRGTCTELLDAPTVAGAFPRCESPSGARDMAGGVWEWTASPLELPERGAAGALREVRGGSWFVDGTRARCRPEFGYPAAEEDARFEDVGFRCCRGDEAESPAPAEKSPSPTVTCPEGMVAVDAFCIDAYEHPNRPGELPLGGLDLPAAKEACTSRGLRLCTGQEWERACAGASLRRWPYGDTYDPAACNFGAAAREEGQPQLLPSGAMEGCATPEGIHDQTGNLWEWTTDARGTGQLRGGCWNVTSGLGQCWFAVYPTEAFSLPEVGVRCCTDGA